MNAQLIESSPVEPLVVGVNLYPGDTWFREIRVVSTTSQAPVDLSAWVFEAHLGDAIGAVDASRAAEGLLSVTFAPSVTASAKRGTKMTIAGTLDGGRRTFVVGRVGAEVGSSIPVGLVQRKRVVQTDVDISVYAARRGDKGEDGASVSPALVARAEAAEARAATAADAADIDAVRAGTSAFSAGQSAATALGHKGDAERAAKTAADVAASLSNRRSRAQRAIIVGDSIAQASDGVASGYGGSWFSKLCELSGMRLLRIRNAGIAGNSTAAMLARLNADVLMQRGDIVVIEAVTPNDDPAALTLAQQQRNVRSIVEQCLFRGKRVVLCGGPPSNTPAIATRLREMTAWARSLATQLGLDYIDLFTPVGVEATGAWAAGFTADGVHPNAAGQDAIAAYNVTRLPDDLRPAPVLANLGDTTNLLAGNGLFEVDTNADGYADGWTNSSLIAGTLTPRADGVGNWQSITADQSTDYLQQAGITGWAVGDVLALAGEWVNVDGTGVSVELRFTGGSPYSVARAISARAETGGARTFYMEIPVPTGTTAVNLRLWPTIGTVRFGRLKLANLTSLALV